MSEGEGRAPGLGEVMLFLSGEAVRRMDSHEFFHLRDPYQRDVVMLFQAANIVDAVRQSDVMKKELRRLFEAGKLIEKNVRAVGEVDAETPPEKAKDADEGAAIARVEKAP